MCGPVVLELEEGPIASLALGLLHRIKSHTQYRRGDISSCWVDGKIEFWCSTKDKPRKSCDREGSIWGQSLNYFLDVDQKGECKLQVSHLSKTAPSLEKFWILASVLQH
jgi:hypothetical protein